MSSPEPTDTEKSAVSGVKRTNENGIILVPQPSESANDPFNWPLLRKSKLLAILCIAACSGTAGALAGQIAYPVQAPVYGKTTLELSYSASAALAGIAGGPLILAPLKYVFGRPSVIFWALLGSIGCGIWAACMTGANDYIPFVMSRLLSGIFGSLPSTVGASMILDTFFLHQRGRAFVCYAISTAFGVIAAPTFGGFIVSTQKWPVCFWWTVALQGLAACLVLFFLEETGFDHHTGADKKPANNYLKDRATLFFPGTRNTHGIGQGSFKKSAAAPFLIGLSPCTAMAGLFIMLFFGWNLLLNVLTPTFLQTPTSKGGYGFTPEQNAAFSFAGWFGLIAAQTFGSVYNDSLPLWICRRSYNGIWAPELRLYSLIVPLICMPVGLAISAAALAYHYHYMVLALGTFIVGFSAVLAQPVVLNYVVESYTEFAVEATIAVEIYRLGWGIGLTFIAGSWEARLGAGWMFGMATLFSLTAGSIVAVLIRKGHVLRKLTLLKSLVSTEAGEMVD